MRRQRFLIAVADHSILIAVAIAFLAPIVFIALTALMTDRPGADADALAAARSTGATSSRSSDRRRSGAGSLNTLIYAGLATLGVLVSSIPVAYALSKLRWRGRDAVFLVVLVALMLPPQVAVVPLYVMWAKLGNAIGFQFVGSLWPLIIPAWLGDAFSIFLLRQFFLTIPEEYLDAARVDGCGEFRILTTVVLRLAKPAIAAVALFSVLYTLQRLLPAAALHGREPVRTGRCRSGSRSSATCTRCSGT